MRKYKINIQFADPDAPDFDDEIMSVFDNAISNYNTKSLIAKNKKRITSKTVLDPRTLQLILESEIDLPFPSKALRLFSAYLIDPETGGAMNNYIYGKQLFKMYSEEVIEDTGANTELMLSEELNSIRLKAISLILAASQDTLKKVVNLLEEV